MPASIDLQRFRDELEQLYLTEDYTHHSHWLADRGLIVPPRTLKRRLKDGASHDEGLPERPLPLKRFLISSTLPPPMTISLVYLAARIWQSQHNRSNRLA